MIGIFDVDYRSSGRRKDLDYRSSVTAHVGRSTEEVRKVIHCYYSYTSRRTIHDRFPHDLQLYVVGRYVAIYIEFSRI